MSGACDNASSTQWDTTTNASTTPIDGRLLRSHDVDPGEQQPPGAPAIRLCENGYEMNSSGVTTVIPGRTATCSMPAMTSSGQSRSANWHARKSVPSDTAGANRLAPNPTREVSDEHCTTVPGPPRALEPRGPVVRPAARRLGAAGAGS